MPVRGQLAYDPGGRIFVIADGDEILVHDGDSEGPLWREDLGEAVVGVAIAGDEIVAVTEDGSVRRFTFLHRELPRASVGPGVTSFAVRADGGLVAAHAEHVSLLRKNDLASAPLYHRGVTALGWSADGTRLLVGKSESESAHVLVWLDGSSGEPLAEPTALELPAVAIAWSPTGFLVAMGESVVRSKRPGEAVAHVTRARGKRITDVAVSGDGKRFAAQIDRSQVIVLSDPPSDTLLSLEYPQRVCAGVAFGPRPWLGVALGGGDANKVNVDTGALHRSDTHPGRSHQRWIVMVGGAFQRARPQAAPAPTPKAAAPEAFERELERQRELNRKRAAEQADADLERLKQSEAEDGRRMLHIGLALLALLLGIARACAHSGHY